MSSVFSGGNVSGIESALTGLVPQFSGYASQAAGLEPLFLGQGQNDIYPTALDQYQAGATGQLTPSEQASVEQTKKEMDLGTRNTYGNLGLGGSTMESQDLGSNDLRSLAQQHGFNVSDETLGLSGLDTALKFEGEGLNALTGAGNILSGATGALGSAGQLAAGQQAAQTQILGSLGSALGGKF